MGRSPPTPYVRAVKRAFADALLIEIRRAQLRRNDAASAGRVSRAYLQLLLKAERHITLGTFIALAEGIGLPPEALLVKTLKNLGRIRDAESSPGEKPLTTHSADSSE